MASVGRTAKVLLVDDTPLNIKVLAAVLVDEGYEISVALEPRPC